MLVPLVLLVLSAAAFAVGAGFGWALWRRRWLIADLPTSDAAHVFVGMNEVTGTVSPAGHLLVAPYTAIQCVWYRSLLEREVQNGDKRSWKTVDDVTSEAPFWVQDRSGHVLVRPAGAAVYARERHRDTHSGRPLRYSGAGLLGEASAVEGGFLSQVFSSTDRHRTTEWVLRPDEHVYVLGNASLRPDAVALEFTTRDHRTGARLGSLLISSGDETRAARRTLWQGLGLLALALVGAATLPIEWELLQIARATPAGEPTTGGEVLEAARGGIIAVVAAFLLALPVVTVVRIHNRLVEVRNRAEAAWSLVDVHLRRRHDLIPQLVAVVQAAAAHERSVQEAVARARAEATAEPPPARALPDRATLDAAAAVDAADRTASHRLLAVAEALPDLRVDQHFAHLAHQITVSEDGIAFARTFYNDALTVMEDRRRQFPGSLLAPLVRMPTMARFEPDLPEARPAAQPGGEPEDAVPQA